MEKIKPFTITLAFTLAEGSPDGGPYLITSSTEGDDGGGHQPRSCTAAGDIFSAFEAFRSHIKVCMGWHGDGWLRREGYVHDEIAKLKKEAGLIMEVLDDNEHGMRDWELQNAYAALIKLTDEIRTLEYAAELYQGGKL